MPRSGSSPRERRQQTGRDEWTTAVESGRNEPLDLPDALAMSFTATVLEVMGDPESLATAAGEDVGDHRRAAYEFFAREIGMKRETFRLTLQGARWVTLSELATALDNPVLGPPLARHLEQFLSLLPRVLHKDQKPGPGQGSGSAGARVGLPNKTEATGRSEEVRTIEDRIRRDVTTLDRLMIRAARSGRSIKTSADWRTIRRALDVPRQPATQGPGVGMAGRTRRAGVHNLTELVRSHLRTSASVRTYAVRAAIQQDHLQITAAQIDAAFARLHQRGEVRRVERGCYEATPTLKNAGG